MAFQIQNFSRSSMSANERIVDRVSVNQYDTVNTGKLRVDSLGTFGLFHYFSKTYATTGGPVATTANPTGDSITDMMVAGYFNMVASAMQPGDVIDVYSYKDSSYARFTVLQTYASSGNNVALVPGVIVKLVGPVRTVLTVPLAQVRTLFSVGVPILGNSANNNCLISVDKAIFYISAGTAYASASGAPNTVTTTLQYNNVGNTNALSTTVPVTLFTAGTNQILGITGIASSRDYINNSIVLKTQVNDFTAGASPLYVEIESNIYSF